MKKKKKKLKIPKAKLKAYWLAVECVEDVYWKQIRIIEKYISKDTGVKDIELFRSIPEKCPFCKKELMIDGSICGIGTANRKYGLLHR